MTVQDSYTFLVRNIEFQDESEMGLYIVVDEENKLIECLVLNMAVQTWVNNHCRIRTVRKNRVKK